MTLANDLDRILWTEDQIAGRVAELASQISGDFKHLAPPPVVVGVATGAFVFLADIVRKITLPVVVDFIRVESYGSGTESSGTPRISCDIKVDVSEKHVILVEDIVDTGNTLSCLIPHLEKKGASSVSVCTFLDKPARRRAQFQLVGDGKFYNGFEDLRIPTELVFPKDSYPSLERMRERWSPEHFWAQSSREHVLDSPILELPGDSFVDRSTKQYKIGEGCLCITIFSALPSILAAKVPR